MPPPPLPPAHLKCPREASRGVSANSKEKKKSEQKSSKIALKVNVYYD